MISRIVATSSKSAPTEPVIIQCVKKSKAFQSFVSTIIPHAISANPVATTAISRRFSIGRPANTDSNGANTTMRIQISRAVSAISRSARRPRVTPTTVATRVPAYFLGISSNRRSSVSVSAQSRRSKCCSFLRPADHARALSGCLQDLSAAVPVEENGDSRNRRLSNGSVDEKPLAVG